MALHARSSIVCCRSADSRVPEGHPAQPAVAQTVRAAHGYPRRRALSIVRQAPACAGWAAHLPHPGPPLEYNRQSLCSAITAVGAASSLSGIPAAHLRCDGAAAGSRKALRLSVRPDRLQPAPSRAASPVPPVPRFSHLRFSLHVSGSSHSAKAGGPRIQNGVNGTGVGFGVTPCSPLLRLPSTNSPPTPHPPPPRGGLISA
jgi:hypothetical protein